MKTLSNLFNLDVYKNNGGDRGVKLNVPGGVEVKGDIKVDGDKETRTGGTSNDAVFVEGQRQNPITDDLAKWKELRGKLGWG